jgi:DNA-binding transcriptional ArsR family regulator
MTPAIAHAHRCALAAVDAATAAGHPALVAAAARLAQVAEALERGEPAPRGPGRSERRDVAPRILDFLRATGPATDRTICHELRDVPRSTVRRRLHALAAAGKIRDAGGMRWGLA